MNYSAHQRVRGDKGMGGGGQGKFMRKEDRSLQEVLIFLLK